MARAIDAELSAARPRLLRAALCRLADPHLLDTAIDDSLAALYVLAISTGMRQGELLALRWQDIDLNGASVHIQSTLHRTRTGFVFSELKTSRSRRQVALTQTGGCRTETQPRGSGRAPP